MAGALFLQPNVVSRTWEYWSMRLDLAGGTPPGAASAKKAKVTRKAAKG
jgi:hypothetical protein